MPMDPARLWKTTNPGHLSDSANAVAIQCQDDLKTILRENREGLSTYEKSARISTFRF